MTRKRVHIPACLTEDAIESLIIAVNEIAANCSVTNGQLLDAIMTLFDAALSVGERNDALMPKFLDEFERLVTGDGDAENC